MGVLDRVHRSTPVGIFNEQSAVQAWKLLGGVLPGGMGIPPTRGTPEFLRAYAQMPWLRAVTSRIASAVARADWQLYVVRKAGERARRMPAIQRAAGSTRRQWLKQAAAAQELEPVTEHPLLTILSGANDFQTGYGMRKLTQVHLDLVGDAFWLKERDAQNTPVAVWPIPPHWILATPTPAFRFFRVGFRAWRGNIPDTEFVWFSDDDPLNPYGRGVGMAQALTDELETDEYAARMTKSFFYNQARPDLLIWPKDQGMSPANIQRLEEDWLSKAQGFFKCHDDQTQVLTRRGWVFGLDLRDSDEVSTWNEAAQRLEFQRPEHRHCYDYDGVLHHWRGGRIDAAVTPNHRMWVADKDGRWRFEESERLARRGGPIQWREAGLRTTDAAAVVVIPPVAWSGVGRPPRGLDEPLTFDALAFAPLVGYVASEGWVSSSHVGISQFGQDARKQAIVAHIDSSVRVFATATQRGVATCTVTNDLEHEWYLGHKGFAVWAAEHIGVGAAQKHLPAEAFDWPQDAREALLNSLINGDGVWQDAEQRSATFVTTSQQLADDVQRLSVELGWRSRCIGAVSTTPDGPCPHWRISIAKRPVRWLQKRNQWRAESGWIHEMPYVGKVWCVSVPNGTLLTRRQGCVLVSGNSFKPYFLSRAVEVKELDQNFRSLQFVQLRQFERDTILQTFGIPPEILGSLENSNRATIDSADYLMAHYLVEPRLEFLRTVMQERLVPEYDERLILDYANPVQEDRATQQTAAVAAPWALTLDEWRALAGRPPMEDPTAGRLHMVPFALSPTDLVESAASGPGPSAPGAASVAAGAIRGMNLVGPELEADLASAMDAQDDGLVQALEKAMSLDLAALPVPSAVAARMEPALQRALVRAWATHAQQISLAAVARALGPAGVHGDLMAALDVPALQAAQTAVLEPTLVRGMLRGAELGAVPLRRAGVAVRDEPDARMKAGVVLDLAGVNPLATAWARAHAAALVQAPAEAQAQIRRLVAQANEDGIAPADLARLIRDTVGLTERQALAVEAFQARLTAEALETAVVARRVARYAGAQLRARAMSIARTELIAAVNAGQQAAWHEAVRQGAIRREQFHKIWLITDDDRLDEEICEPLADVEVEIDEVFPGGYLHPPAHPSCRCAIGLIAATKQTAQPTITAGVSPAIHIHLPSDNAKPRVRRLRYDAQGNPVEIVELSEEDATRERETR